jgi:hypothetical protein
VQSGFNTTHAGPLTPTQEDVTLVNSLATDMIPIIKIGGVDFREFAFSLQQIGGQNTIDITMLYLAGIADTDLQTYNFAASLKIIDSATTDYIRLTDVWGGTRIDMLMYVPANNSVFASTYISMYNYMDGGNDGPDEWAVFDGGGGGGAQADVPEPLSALAWAGLFGIGAVASRFRRRKDA